MNYEFRWAGMDDYPLLAEVMFDAVRNGPSPYNEAQRAAWLPNPHESPEWDERLGLQQVILAKHEDKTLGFMSLKDNGYIDLAFVRPSARGTGLFREMLLHIEGRAASKGMSLLWVHASLSAQPAFSAAGFTIRSQEDFPIKAERLRRFEMDKTIRTQP